MLIIKHYTVENYLTMNFLCLSAKKSKQKPVQPALF